MSADQPESPLERMRREALASEVARDESRKVERPPSPEPPPEPVYSFCLTVDVRVTQKRMVAHLLVNGRPAGVMPIENLSDLGRVVTEAVTAAGIKALAGMP